MKRIIVTFSALVCFFVAEVNATPPKQCDQLIISGIAHKIYKNIGNISVDALQQTVRRKAMLDYCGADLDKLRILGGKLQHQLNDDDINALVIKEEEALLDNDKLDLKAYQNQIAMEVDDLLLVIFAGKDNRLNWRGLHNIIDDEYLKTMPIEGNLLEEKRGEIWKLMSQALAFLSVAPINSIYDYEGLYTSVYCVEGVNTTRIQNNFKELFIEPMKIYYDVFEEGEATRPLKNVIDASIFAISEKCPVEVGLGLKKMFSRFCYSGNNKRNSIGVLLGAFGHVVTHEELLQTYFLLGGGIDKKTDYNSYYVDNCNLVLSYIEGGYNIDSFFSFFKAYSNKKNGESLSIEDIRCKVLSIFNHSSERLRCFIDILNTEDSGFGGGMAYIAKSAEIANKNNLFMSLFDVFQLQPEDFNFKLRMFNLGAFGAFALNRYVIDTMQYFFVPKVIDVFKDRFLNFKVTVDKGRVRGLTTKDVDRIFFALPKIMSNVDKKHSVGAVNFLCDYIYGATKERGVIPSLHKKLLDTDLAFSSYF